MKDSSNRQERAVLMLCYHFPPVSTAGTQRNVAFARLLPRFGWKPIVLTVSAQRNRFERSGEPPPTGIDIVRTYEWDLHRCLMLATGVLNRASDLLRIRRRTSVFFRWCLPDPQIAWLTTVRGIFLNRRYTCLYASCSPFSSALSACMIKKFTRKPLVLDFRDAWALNPHDNYSERQRRVIRLFERWVLRTCDALILNTPGAERLYRLKYPQHASKMTCIPNGYDRLNTPPHGAAPGKFTIMHVGDFYRSRNPNRILEALAKIGNQEIEFVQVGPVFESYDRFKDRVSIRLIDRVAHAEALRLMRSASLLYLSQGWEEGVTDYIAIASKTYEYLATGLPILADCPPGDNADLVNRYASKSWVLTVNGASEVESAVREAFASRYASKPTVTSAFVDEFDRERLAGRLAAVLDTAAGKHVLRDNAPSTAYSK
jgi:glycosyltransferase involved in cell wall biosynthesis